MERTTLKKYVGVVLFAALATSGCGGSNGGIDGTGVQPGNTVEITGTAALGSPIANATVTVKASNGTKKTTTTGTDGKFKSVVTDLPSPYLLRVGLPNGNVLYSVASEGGTTNIHPFTDLIVRNWFKSKKVNIDTEFAGDIATTQLPSASEVNAIKSAIQELFALILSKYNLPANFDLFATAFDADGAGFDKMLDNTNIVIINNTITVVINDPVTNISSNIITNVGLDNNFTQADALAPSPVTNVRVIPASATELIVLWDPATDNVGVAGYRVTRTDLAGITTTPFPVLSDKGLSANTEYCYQIEAFDAKNNVTSKSTAVCGTTLAEATTDTTPPTAAQNLLATALNPSTIALTWDASISTDTVSYEIHRSNVVNSPKIADVTTTTFTIINLSSSTEYCYTVIAVDAAHNKSPASNPACATTPATSNQQPSTGAMSVEFAASAYLTSEADATVVITVNRNGDPSAPASVEYKLQDGTAVAGADYVSTNGVLSWSAGDAAAKSFLVQVKGDTLTEGNETVQLALSNPAGLSLGTNANATLSISDSACSGRLSSNVIVDTTISAPCTLVTSYVYINSNATLTIMPGITLVFQNSTGLNIEQDGALIAKGTQTKPILFTGQQHTPGYWSGIQYTFSNNNLNELDHVTVEFGGAMRNGTANVVMYGTTGLPQRLKIKNSTLSDSSGYGLEFDDGSIIDGFSNNIATRNAKGPALLPANIVGKLDGNSNYKGNTRDEVIVVDGSDVTESQTWPALNVPYAMGTGSHSVDGPSNSPPADLTISAGAILRFGAGGGFNVGTNGSLKAVGTPNNFVTFTGQQHTPGYWTGIQYTFSNSVFNDLEYVLIEDGGGSGGNGNSNVVMYGTTGLPQRLKLSHSILRNSSGYGFEFSLGTVVDSFSSNTITGNILGAGKLPPGVVHVLDSASSYQGNGRNTVLVDDGYLDSTQTWPAINVSYSAGNITVVDNVQWTIAAGAQLVFRGSGYINVSKLGTLIANGSASAPILFTAEQASPGYWEGIQFTFSNTNNVMNYTTVEYGGTRINGEGNVSLYGTGTLAPKLILTNSILRFSSTYGLWLDKAPQINSDVSTSNTFSSNKLGDIYQAP